MSTQLSFPPVRLGEEAEAFRLEVRGFLESERRAGTFGTDNHSWGGWNPELSRKLGARGWIGMTWPKQYGGGERSYLDRYIYTEELLAAGAPAGAHWVADRQSGPLFIRFGTDEQKRTYLPPITRGEAYYSIGMSEPDAGSDLASIRSKAERDGDGWRLTGTKIWTSGAHRNHWMIALVRTEPVGGDRHAGMSQFLVDLKSEGLTIRPIRNIAGDEGFNEVVMDRVFVPNERLVGEPGAGWRQVTSELAYERAGPERFLTNLHLLRELIGTVGENATRDVRAKVGRAASHLWTLRQMSLSIASMLSEGKLPNTEA